LLHPIATQAAHCRTDQDAQRDSTLGPSWILNATDGWSSLPQKKCCLLHPGNDRNR